MISSNSFGRSAIVLLGMLGSSGCRLAIGATALTVGVAAVGGYTVYKVGEAAVVTTGAVVAAGADGVHAIVYNNGYLEVAYPEVVEKVYNAAYVVFLEMAFTSLDGNVDGLSGKLQAKTSQSQPVVAELTQLEGQKTLIRLKVGTKGDLKASEIIYDKILSILQASSSEKRT